MKNTDKARSKEFGFVIIMEHASDNTVDSREKGSLKENGHLKTEDVVLEQW